MKQRAGSDRLAAILLMCVALTARMRVGQHGECRGRRQGRRASPQQETVPGFTHSASVCRPPPPAATASEEARSLAVLLGSGAVILGSGPMVDAGWVRARGCAAAKGGRGCAASATLASASGQRA